MKKFTFLSVILLFGLCSVALAGVIARQDVLIHVTGSNAGNGADTTEDTLINSPVPAGYWNTPIAPCSTIEALFSTAANTDVKHAVVYFGSQAIANAATATSGQSLYVHATVCRKTYDTEDIMARIYNGSSSTFTYTAGTQDTTGTINIKTTGTTAVSNASDVVNNDLLVRSDKFEAY